VNANIAVDGLNYQVVLSDPEDHIQKHMLNGEPYEHDMLRDMAGRVGANGWIVDVGANIGNHSLYLTAMGFYVMAFEPDPLLAKCIQSSMEINQFYNMEVQCAGLGSENTTAEIVTQLNGNIGAQSLRVGRGDIPVYQLDEFMVNPSVIKIDVEGMEFKVLYGARETIARSRPVLYVESSDWKPLAEWAKDNNYVRKARFNSTPTYLLVPEES
jgi:FkbM family methyltransferase